MPLFYILHLFVFFPFASATWIPQKRDIPLGTARVDLIHNPLYDFSAEYYRLSRHNTGPEYKKQKRDSTFGSGPATFTTHGRYLFPLTIGGQTFMMDFDTG